MAWHNQARYGFSSDSTEAEENVKMMADILVGQCGWSLNAVAGLAGNQFAESGYNPWRWESDDILASTDTDLIATSKVHGYGLFQFTPSGKYINSASGYSGYGPNYSDKTGSENDGTAQLLFINDNADYYATSSYPLSFDEFKTSTQTGGYLALAWLYNYERPADPSATAAQREQYGNYWQGVLTGYTPSGTSSWKYGAAREIIRRLILHF